MCGGGGGGGDAVGEGIRVREKHVAMIEEIRLLKKAARERDVSDEKNALLASSRLRSTWGTGAAPNVSAAKTSGQDAPRGTSHGVSLSRPILSQFGPPTFG